MRGQPRPLLIVKSRMIGHRAGVTAYDPTLPMGTERTTPCAIAQGVGAKGASFLRKQRLVSFRLDWGYIA